MNNVITKNISKYKSILVSVSYIMPLEVENASKNALLSILMDKKSAKYKTEKEIAKALADIYDAKLSVVSTKNDQGFILRFDLEVVKDKKALLDALNIFYEIMLNPAIDSDKMCEDIFERERKNALDAINEEKDNKRTYAIKKLEKIMYQDDAYSESVHGNEISILRETPESIALYYNKVLSEAQVIISVIGNLEEDENIGQSIKTKIEESLGRNTKFNIKRAITRKELVENVRFEEEKQQVLQSVLAIGLGVEDTDKKDLYKKMVYAQVLGGNPASKLFQNVREKESLAYFTKAMYNRHKESIYIVCGIDHSKFEKAKLLSIEQTKLIESGQISTEELDAARKILIGSLMDTNDKKEDMLQMLTANSMYFGTPVEINEMIENIESVTKEDVIEIAKKVKLDTIFLLGGVIDAKK